MGTTKLGLKIAKSYNGYSEGFGANENAAWVKSVRDTRNDCKYVLGLKENCDTSVIMYSANQIGEFYTIISVIPGRPTDFISAWIYCPLDIEISGDEMSKIIEATRREILANEVNEERLMGLFSKEYPQVCIPKACTTTEGIQYAVRYYGADTFYGSLSELLESNMAQPENRRYKGIFLIDNNSSLKAADDCINITKTILKESFIFNPPQETLGYTPYYSDKPFTSPIRLIKGEKLSIVWKKEGFKDVPTETVIDSPGTKVNAVTEADERVIIRLGDFDIRDEDGYVDKSNLTIRVGNMAINLRQNVAIHVSHLANSEVSVIGKGYKAFHGQVDLRNKPVPIRLKKDSYIYECCIPLELEDGVKAKCTARIESNRQLEHTPIKGYRSSQGFYEDHKNNLYYDESGKKKSLILLVIALLLGMLIGSSSIYLIYRNKILAPKESVVQKGNVEERENVEERGDVEEKGKERVNAAVKYLDEHPTWIKSEMERIDELKGLWEEINTYKYDAILKRSELKKSPKFKELCTQIEALQHSGKNMGNTWICIPGDESININIMIEKMGAKVAPEPKVNATPGENKPGGNKNNNKSEEDKFNETKKRMEGM